MIKVAFAFPEELNDLFINKIKNIDLEADLNFFSEKSELDCFHPEVIVTNQYSWVFEHIKSNPDLKWVHFMSSGVDKFISDFKDIDLKMIVTNVKGIHRESISNYIILCLLLNNTNYLSCLNSLNRIRSSSLINQKALIFGLGNIGESVYEKLNSFQLNSIGVVFDSNKQRDCKFINIINFKNVESILNDIDFLIITAPLTETTLEFFDSSKLNLLKKECIIINVSRFEIFNLNDFIDFVKSNKTVKVFSDVLPQNLVNKNFLLENLKDIPNFYFTNHISGYFQSGYDDGLNKFFKLFKQYKTNGISNQYLVDVRKGY